MIRPTHAHDDRKRYAEELGLDADRLARELGAHTYGRRIQEDVRGGLACSAQGTPTLYFNGQLHAGGYDDTALRAVIHRLAASAAPAS